MTRQEMALRKQESPSVPGAQSRRILIAYLVMSAFAVFYVPYFFPVRPATSYSYMFGYNNAVGCGLLLILAFVGALGTRGMAIVFPNERVSSRVPARVLHMTLAVIGCACASLYLLSGRFSPPWEGMQILNRTYLLTLNKRPYVDFEFPWGPSFLYLPAWLSTFLHLSIVQSYAIVWTATSLVSVYLLHVVINWIDVPAPNKTTIFLLFSFVALLSVGNMGLNYTLLRYVSPLFLVLIVFRLSRRDPTTSSCLVAGLIAIVFSAMLFLVSPEVAVSHIFACAVLLLPARQLRATMSAWANYLGAIAGFGVLLVLCYRFHLLDSLFLDGGGANGFPIAFGPATLAYFGSVYVSACYLLDRFRKQETQDNTIAIILYSIPMCAAALGRCDPAHILLNGIGFFLVTLLAASASGCGWKLSRNLFIACPLGLCVLVAFLAMLIGISRPEARIFPLKGDIASLYQAFSKVAPRSRFQIPFGYGPNAKGYLFSRQIDYGFFFGGADANTPRAIARQIDELKRSPEDGLLLTSDFEKQCEVNQRDGRIVVSVLSGFPYLVKVIHFRSVREPLCDYIRAHYSLVEAASDQNFGYGLWMSR